jgi:hypothetical protein
MFAFDLVVGLIDQVLQEELGRESDDKGGVVRALRNVRIYVDDLLDTGDCDVFPSRLALHQKWY